MNIPIIVSENWKYLYKTTKLRLNGSGART